MYLAHSLSDTSHMTKHSNVQRYIVTVQLIPVMFVNKVVKLTNIYCIVSLSWLAMINIVPFSLLCNSMQDEWTKVAKGFLSKIQASQQFERG